jgi:hypothetical protein
MFLATHVLSEVEGAPRRKGNEQISELCKLGGLARENPGPSALRNFAPQRLCGTYSAICVFQACHDAAP